MARKGTECLALLWPTSVGTSLIFAVHGQEGNCMPTRPVAHKCGYLSLIFVVHIQEENCMPTPPVPHKCRYLFLIFAVHG